jgi:hypothetical protein
VISILSSYVEHQQLSGGAVLFGLCVGGVVILLRPGAKRLDLTSRGFTIFAPFRKFDVAWDDVAEFGAVP